MSKTARLSFIIVSATAALLGLVAAGPALAAGPSWDIVASSNTTVPAGGQITYYVTIENTGDPTDPTHSADSTDGSEIDLTVDLPPQITAVSATVLEGTPFDCSELLPGSSEPFTCRSTEILGYQVGTRIAILADVSPSASGSPTISYVVSGGAAASTSTADTTAIAPTPPGFGIDSFDTQLLADAAGAPFTQAAGHPYSVDTQILFNTHTDSTKGDIWPLEPPKDILVDLPPGLVGNPTVLTRCNAEQLQGVNGFPICPPSSQVGTVRLRFNGPPAIDFRPVFNMVPPTGAPARFGFTAMGSRIVLDASLRSDGDYGLSVGSRNSIEHLALIGSEVTFWGAPASPLHDSERSCPAVNSLGCTVDPGPAFLRNSTFCPGPDQGLPWAVRVSSWDHPGDFKSAGILSHDPPNFPAAPEDRGTAQGPTDCDVVPVDATLHAEPTSPDTNTSSGLAVHIEVPSPGLENPKGIASSDIKAVEVTLPEGVTVNPSQAEGLGACSPAQYQSTELSFFPTPGKGCPDDAKIGTVEVHTPLLEETIPGDVYIAQPYDNPFSSLLALYIVLHEPERGILVKLAGEVKADQSTGQITTSFDDLPQLPFESFDFKFREGARAPLVTPPACGTYTTKAEFSPWSAFDPETGEVAPEDILHTSSDFQITHGIGGGPCPSGGLPPFKPGLIAGSLNNNAGSYSPFNLRLFRTDAEQEITHFSIKLPPGLIGKLAGVPFCPEASIAAAKSRTGTQELQSPSCPAASEVGHSLAGAGVGSVLTYAPGKIYLAGPYNGSALSIAAITAAKVGPFDLGTVVVRQALKIDPETAEVFIDATGSDPIPHIIDGITTHLRDIRAYVDRPEFTLNPTSCDPTSTASTLLGSGLDFASAADDVPVTVSTRYQAANCASLPFKPKLALNLLGATKRGANPKLRAVLKMRGGEANIAKAQVTLPHSEFLDQAHIGTLCTRVQFAQGPVPGSQCPPKSVYGYARAFTPLLDTPIEGPVFLRSSEHKLPDLIAALHNGQIDIVLEGRIDSVKGRIRNTFEAVPDAPVSKFVLTMQGGKKGLLQNSTDLCSGPHRAIVKLEGHNGKVHDTRPALGVRCGEAHGKGKRAAGG